MAALAHPVMSSTAGNHTIRQLTVTYDQAINCASVDANGSDFTAHDSTSNFDFPINGAACSGTIVNGQSITVTITYGIPLTPPQLADSYSVTSANGGDGNTVDNGYGAINGDYFEPALTDSVAGSVT